jgi:hypothetical protein
MHSGSDHEGGADGGGVMRWLEIMVEVAYSGWS